MHAWQSRCLSIVHALLGRPSDHLELIAAWVVALLTLVLVMRACVAPGAERGQSVFRHFMALVSGLGVGIGAAGLADLFAGSLAASPFWQWTFVIGAAVLSILVIAAPIQAYLLKSSYVGALVSFGAAVAATAVTLLLVHTLFDSFASGRQDSILIRKHKEGIEDMLK